jgi:hypothetical protein
MELVRRWKHTLLKSILRASNLRPNEPRNRQQAAWAKEQGLV